MFTLTLRSLGDCCALYRVLVTNTEHMLEVLFSHHLHRKSGCLLSIDGDALIASLSCALSTSYIHTLDRPPCSFFSFTLCLSLSVILLFKQKESERESKKNFKNASHSSCIRKKEEEKKVLSYKLRFFSPLPHLI